MRGCMARHTSRASSPAHRLNRHVERNVGAAVRASKRPTDAQRETVYASEVGGRRIEIAAAFLESHFSAFRRYCEIQPFENRVSTNSPSSAGARLTRRYLAVRGPRTFRHDLEAEAWAFALAGLRMDRRTTRHKHGKSQRQRAEQLSNLHEAPPPPTAGQSSGTRSEDREHDERSDAAEVIAADAFTRARALPRGSARAASRAFAGRSRLPARRGDPCPRS
jgi:hypothetical protein